MAIVRDFRQMQKRQRAKGPLPGQFGRARAPSGTEQRQPGDGHLEPRTRQGPDGERSRDGTDGRGIQRAQCGHQDPRAQERRLDREADSRERRRDQDQPGPPGESTPGAGVYSHSMVAGGLLEMS